MISIWDDQKNVDLFSKYAGNMYDFDLACMLGCKAADISARRKQLGIKKFDTDNYPEGAIKYVLENCKTKGDVELAEDLNRLYPMAYFTGGAIRVILRKNNLLRTPAERKRIRQLPFSKGRKSAALKKRHEGHCRKIGDIVYCHHSNKKQWCIKVAYHKYKPYAKYLWLKHYGTIPGGMRVDWIDPDAPLTIDNVRLIKFIKTTIPIGGVTTWKHQGRVREIIKLGEDEYQLYLPYLWRQHVGEIPPGMWVEKIDNNKPTTVNNLRLTQQTVFAEGSKNLDDWYIRGLLSRGISKEARQEIDANPDLKELKRLQVIASRELKKIENGG